MIALVMGAGEELKGVDPRAGPLQASNFLTPGPVWNHNAYSEHQGSIREINFFSFE